ncbi:MAG: RHS repeat-associated core domain-containing protein, partial [Acidimicrobiales bacterium]
MLTFLIYTPSDSSWLATSAAGNELAFWRYDAFESIALGSPDSEFGYAGQYSDPASVGAGFNNMRARWYQPQTGQFTSVDSAFRATDEAYGYAGSDPGNQADPDGEGNWWQGAKYVTSQKVGATTLVDKQVFDALGESGALGGWSSMPQFGETPFDTDDGAMLYNNTGVNSKCGEPLGCVWVYGPIIQLVNNATANPEAVFLGGLLLVWEGLCASSSNCNCQTFPQFESFVLP